MNVLLGCSTAGLGSMPPLLAAVFLSSLVAVAAAE
jgi:hypothetical protein